MRVVTSRIDIIAAVAVVACYTAVFVRFHFHVTQFDQ